LRFKKLEVVPQGRIEPPRALHEHEHQLAAYCATCERWAVLDLARLIAEGRGDYCFVGRKPRYSYWNTRTRFPRAALCNQLLE
jgi:hypothetical protein